MSSGSLALSLLAAVALSPSPCSLPAQSPCSGCFGSSSVTDTDSELTCSVTVAVDVHAGNCLPTGASCAGSPCEVTITRQWTLPIGTRVDFCCKHGVAPPWSCTFPPHTAGQDMHPESSTQFEDLRCGRSETYRISATACGRNLVAQVVGTCSKCP